MANMYYYIIMDKETHDYFINKAQKPVASVRHHFHRAENPNRPDYNSEFYTRLREKGEEGFYITYSKEMPLWAQARAHFIKAHDGVEVPPIVSFEELAPKKEKIKGKKK